MRKLNPPIPKAVNNWVKVINGPNVTPDQMANLYSQSAVLLATFSSFLKGHKEIKGYFVDFLDKKNLTCSILKNDTKILNPATSTEIANGIYVFSFWNENNQREMVIARYTYVCRKGKIITHHSSLNPEK